MDVFGLIWCNYSAHGLIALNRQIFSANQIGQKAVLICILSANCKTRRISICKGLRAFFGLRGVTHRKPPGE